MKKRLCVGFLIMFVFAALVFASGHIRSQKAKCGSCSCTYFSCDGDIAGKCYCKCGHSWSAHH